MAPLESVPAGTPADGNGLVVFVEALTTPAEPDSVALNAGVKLTYSLVPDGYRLETTENTINSGRFTLKQVLDLPGTVTDSLELQYVVGSPAESLLTEGKTGYIVVRLGYGNEVAFAAGQKVTVIPVRAGLQREVPPTANTELAIVQRMYVTGTVHRRVFVDGDES
jgi:hypothetical protein